MAKATPFHHDHETTMNLPEKERAALLEALDVKRPEVIQARMANAILLLSDGLPVEDVAGLLFLDEETVSGWKRMFEHRLAA